MLKDSYSTRNPRFIAAMGLLVSLTVASEAATWYVRPEGGGAGTGWGDALGSFQTAIAAATAGDEIWGASGVYNEFLTLKAGIALYGGFAAVETVREDRDFVANPTILDATGLNQRVITADRTDGVTIDGFTIRNGKTPSSILVQDQRGAGIYFNRVSSATLSNCTISDNKATSGGGVYSFFSSPTLTHCTITGNTADNGGGVFCDRSPSALTNCTVSGNSAKRDGGGVFCDRSSPVLIHCTISGNTTGYGGVVFVSGSSASPTLINCILWNPGNEISVDSGSAVVRYSCAQGGYPGEGNIDAYPQFVDPLNGDWRLRDGSSCIDHGADLGLPFNGAGPDMGSWEAPGTYSQGPPDHVPQLYRVDSAALPGGDGHSWETAFRSISESLFSSSTSDEIWVAAGTYNESITMNTGLALYGGFAGTEMVRGDRDFASNPTVLDAAGLIRRVITADGTEGVTIDGFTIRNGNAPNFGPTKHRFGGGIYFDRVLSATVNNCAISGNTAYSGGGVYISSSSPTLTHCTISGNRASSGGGGVYCSVSSSPTLTHCTISGNGTSTFGGGVYCSVSSSPTLTHCTITGNGATSYGGGGMACISSSSPTLTHCTITGNGAKSGGGVYCSSSSPRLLNCTISNNRADDGGGVFSISSSPTLTYCAISDNNVIKSGGGVYCWTASPTLTHCTISGNTATSAGGGVYCYSSSSPTLTNCILWNPGDEIVVVSGAPVVRYSCVQGDYLGEGNIDAYPQFVDPLNGDWRLLDESSCIDRGFDVGLPFNGEGPDMGAWEAPESYTQGPPDHVPQLSRVCSSALPGGDGRSWETAFRSIKEALFSSSTSDEIWVAAGTYNESITMNTGLALFGGFAGTELMRGDRDFASNPTILDAAGLNHRAITVYRTDGVTIDGFTIRNGNPAASGGGIYFESVSSATVSNCTISGNRAWSGGGVFCLSSSPTLTHCMISNNTAISSGGGGGMACSFSSSPTLTYCTISNNTVTGSAGGGGMACSSSSSPTLAHCTISGNSTSRDGGGMYCTDHSAPTLTHCAISNNTANQSGGGLACVTSSSPTLTHCSFMGNAVPGSSSSGGGLYCSSSSPTLTHCTISNSSAGGTGGGVYCSNSSATLTDCTILDNTAGGSGGGVCCSESSLSTLTRCTILGNTANRNGGGVFSSSSSPTLTLCTISGNTANQNGGGVYNTSLLRSRPSPRLSHCTISGNTADRNGGGVYCWTSSPTLTHCTIAGNTATSEGGGVYCTETSSPTLTNCILWNHGNEISMDSGAPVVRYSCAQGGYPGAGNIDAHPQFVDPLNGDWRLRDGSPCIDRGADVGLSFNGASPDMGSWEAPATYSQGPPDHVPQLFRVNHAALPGGDGLSWKTAFSTIREALFFSSNSDEIWVVAGTYNESITMNTGLALYGGFAGTETVREGREFASNLTILDATGLNRRVITVDRSDYVTIDGFTIRNGNPVGSGGGIYFDNVSSATVSNCMISGNRAWNGSGVYCLSSSPTLYHCTISGNTATYHGGGVACLYSSSPTLTHCTISGNTATSDGGGVFSDRSTPTLTNCILWNPGHEMSVESGEPVVRYSCAQGGYPGEGNINAYPRFVDPLNGDWRLRDGSPCIDRGADVGLPFRGIGPDMGSWEAPRTYSQGPSDHVPQVFRVDHAALAGGDGLSWETAFSRIRDAILFSSNSDEIWVAAGTANESIRLETGLALYGSFMGTETSRAQRNLMANNTVLDASGLNQRVIIIDRTEGVTIDGFTIRNGNSAESGGAIYFFRVLSATVSNCTIADNTAGGSGGGVFCRFSSPTLTNCTIKNNAAGGSGGGVYGDRSAPTFTHCTISDNTANSNGGGMIVTGSPSSPRLTDCTITGNTANGDGGGLVCNSSTMSNCTIAGNTAHFNGGGVYVAGSSSSTTMTQCTITDNMANREGGGVHFRFASPVLNHCTIMANRAGLYGGGVYCYTSSSTLIQCNITENAASQGGGVYSRFSSPNLIRCTISDNRGWRNGGGVYCSSSSPSLTHCTITGNSAGAVSGWGGGVSCWSFSSPTLTHCTIADNTAWAHGAGVSYSPDSPLRLVNCILWNGGDEVYPNSATAEVTFSAVQGGYPGQGNIDGDPIFVDPEQTDYRLAMGSPCVDSGSNGAVLRLGPAVLAMGDHLGRMRIWDGDGDGIAVVDMGAYEFGPPPFVGDVFMDSRVNHLDLFRFQQVWKQEGDGIIPEADQDGDRAIGPTDLTILLHVWGNVTGP